MEDAPEDCLTDAEVTSPNPNSTTPTLDKLLEHAAKAQAATVGAGILVGECLDTHHPHLPRRVFVRVRDPEGVPIMAWLPTLDTLRVRAGDRVLLSKPDNWPEPVVMGVLAGLARTSDDADSAAEPAPNADGPQILLAIGEQLTVRGPGGAILLRVASTTRGPELTLFEDEVDLKLPGRLRLSAEQLELHAGTGGIDIRTEGDAIVRGRLIRLN